MTVNDIPNTSDLLTWLFADDTALAASADTIANLESKMAIQVAKVQAWLLANKLSVHYIKKSQFMLVNKSNLVDTEEEATWN